MTPPAFLTALPNRAVIEITGADARTFLQRVITKGPAGLEPGRAQFSALLTPHGKVLADFFLFDNVEGGLFIDLPASEAEALLKRLSLYRLRADASIAPRTDLAVAQARGEGEAELATLALAISPDPRSAQMGQRAIVPAGGPVDEDEYEAARIGEGLPEFGKDYGPAEVFPTDVNQDLMAGIDYKKGCFVGQEVASRMHRKGGVRKRTVRVSADNALETQAPVSSGETPLGTITSTAGKDALARVRLDRLKAALERNETPESGGCSLEITQDLDTF